MTTGYLRELTPVKRRHFRVAAERRKMRCPEANGPEMQLHGEPENLPKSEKAPARALRPRLYFRHILPRHQLAHSRHVPELFFEEAA